VFLTALPITPAAAQTLAEKLAAVDFQKSVQDIDAIDRAAWQTRVERLTAKCQGIDPTRIGDMLVAGQRSFASAGIRKRLAEVAWLVDVSIPKEGVGASQCPTFFAVAVGRAKDGLPVVVVDRSANPYRPQ
jgi:hypothetical protein